MVRADLEGRARGEEPEMDKPALETARKRLDENFKAHYKITFPPMWTPSNTTLGTITSHLETRAATTYEIHRVWCHVEKPGQVASVVLKLNPAKGEIASTGMTEEH